MFTCGRWEIVSVQESFLVGLLIHSNSDLWLCGILVCFISSRTCLAGVLSLLSFHACCQVSAGCLEIK